MNGLFHMVSWLDVLDIAIVSVVLYMLLTMHHGTRAAKILIGIALLLAATYASRQIPLYTMDWLLKSFWDYIVIIMIVIFQPEIRTTLARMGEARFFQPFATAEELRGREEIVKAVVTLAERRIGALIVIERDMDLGEFVELGTALDAKITRELLMSIFHPGSPIHDGAVVIKGNRLVAAGCFLPIALTPAISKALGTRHRAALGITEETDCVVLIVSEETGGISMSLNGRLEQYLDMGTLRDKLTEIFATKKVEAK